VERHRGAVEARRAAREVVRQLEQRQVAREPLLPEAELPLARVARDELALPLDEVAVGDASREAAAPPRRSI
jgi:hypothetical protein